MKIETFTKGAWVAVVIFVLCLTVLGSGMIRDNYDTETVPTFGNVSTLHNGYDVTETSLEDTLLQTEDPGQTNEDNPDESRFWVYQGKSLKAVWSVLGSPDDSKGAITEVGSYLNINSGIILSIIVFLVLSLAFAVAAYWRNRRP